MLKSRKRNGLLRICGILSLGLIAMVSLQGCSSDGKRATKAVEDYLKPFGVREVKLEAFHTSKDFPDKAYISVVVTYNNADTTGKYETHHSAYIVRRDGEAWAIVKRAAYTTDEAKAMDYLAGIK
jgi:hypothetical protein